MFANNAEFHLTPAENYDWHSYSYAEISDISVTFISLANQR